MQLEGGSGILRALSYYYYNGYAAVAALAGASFEIVANMTRPDRVQCDLLFMLFMQLARSTPVDP